MQIFFWERWKREGEIKVNVSRKIAIFCVMIILKSDAVQTHPMLMQDQNLYQSLAIEVYGHCRLLIPGLGVPY